MKKFIAVAAILSVMFLGAGTSQALMGVPDAVPGEDILIPFFMVSMPGEGDDNTLFTITDVGGAGVADCFHLRLHDSDSVEQYDEWIDMTADDVYFTDGLRLVNDMSPLGRAALEIDLNGDGTPDHWVGYVHLENNVFGADDNDFIAHVYQVSVLEGVVAGYTGVSLEDATPCVDPRLDGYGIFADVEAFSANALNAARDVLELGAGAFPLVDANWFRLLPRIYLADADSSNILIIWTDEELPAITLPGALHVNFYDQDENVKSSPINIDRELNFINVQDIYPVGLTGTDPYAAGWIDIETTNADATWHADRYWLGYSLQRSMMVGGLTLDVILEAHRDAGL